jgi:apolipoprotein N-acyltransferase
MASVGTGAGAAFRTGYVGGLVHYLISLHWLLYIPFPAGAVAGWIALGLYLALYPAIWACLCEVTLRGFAPSNRHGAMMETAENGAGPLDRLLAGSWMRRAGWALMAAVFWVALEMVVGRLFSGFPWNLLGASQYGMLPLIQIASLTGVYGVSFLVVWFSVGLSLAVLQLMRKPGWHGAWVREAGLPLLAVVITVTAGYTRIARMPVADGELEVALVQPSIPQELIWDPSEDGNRFATMLELSRLSLASEPQLLVWPEAAMPSLSQEHFDALTNLVAEHGVWTVFGADDVERRVTASNERNYDVFNAAFLLGPDGRYVSSYRKRQLVIFGEYVPLERWLPFMKSLTPIQGSFTAGPGPVTFELTHPPARISVLICFEDVFPHVTRQHVKDDTEFLLNLTNNGWFGESSAQWQHATGAALRAVENGLPLVRCTNNGMTCWIDAVGRIRNVHGAESRNIYAPGYMTARIPLRAAGLPPGPTIYRVHGDWFGWGCVMLALVVVGINVISRLTPGHGRRPVTVL